MNRSGSSGSLIVAYIIVITYLEKNKKKKNRQKKIKNKITDTNRCGDFALQYIHKCIYVYALHLRDAIMAWILALRRYLHVPNSVAPPWTSKKKHTSYLFLSVSFRLALASYIRPSDSPTWVIDRDRNNNNNFERACGFIFSGYYEWPSSSRALRALTLASTRTIVCAVITV